MAKRTGRPPKNGTKAMSGAERQAAYRQRLREKAEAAAPPGPVASPLDLETLNANLAHSWDRLYAAHGQLQWLHDAIADDTPNNITGPAWQLMLSLIEWQTLLEQVAGLTGAKLRRRPEIPDIISFDERLSGLVRPQGGAESG